MVRDLLILELLAWFKDDFFSWVDCPKCDACGGETARLEERSQLEPNDQERKDGANRVEG